MSLTIDFIMLRVLIADDHEIVRRGLKQILLEGFPFIHIEEASDCPSLIEKATSGRWDIVVSDLAMPGGGGLQALKHIREKLPELPVLILSIYPEEQYALSVMKSGAAGYLNKDAAPEKLVNAVQRILSGKKFVTEAVAEKLAQRLYSHSDVPLHELLSEREMNVFKLLAAGKSVTEISNLLTLRSTTVSTYRSRILEKMNMKTNVDLARYAMDNKLI
ncbi:MAG TPA: response regulator transcription factor [Chitinophagaceae bacterium]